MKKILVVTTKPPFPLFSGDRLRIYNIYNHLSKKNKVDLIYTGSKENFKKKGKNHIIEDPVKAHEAIKKLEALWNDEDAQKAMDIKRNKTHFILEFETTGAMEAKLALEQALKYLDVHCEEFMTSIDAAA